MVPVASIVAMAVSLTLCVVVPLGGMLWLQSRQRRVWRPFWCGALAFLVSQVLTRIPLMTLVVPTLPEPVSRFLLSLPVSSFSAALFEETGRLVVMLLLLKGFHRLADGLAFGLGHGGLEAVLLVGLTLLNTIVLAVTINSGQWPAIEAALPPDQARAVWETVVEPAPWTFLLGGIERVWAIGLHVACSLLVLAGIVRSRKAVFWLAAVVLHGGANLAATGAVAAHVPAWLVEAVGLGATAAVLWLVVTQGRRRDWWGTLRTGSSAPRTPPPPGGVRRR